MNWMVRLIPCRARATYALLLGASEESARLGRACNNQSLSVFPKNFFLGSASHVGFEGPQAGHARSGPPSTNRAPPGDVSFGSFGRYSPRDGRVPSLGMLRCCRFYPSSPAEARVSAMAQL